MQRIKILDITLELGTIEHTTRLYNAITENRVFLREFLPWVEHYKSKYDAFTYLQQSYKNYKDGIELAYNIFRNEQLIGRIGIHGIDKQNSHASIGYWLVEHEQGRGIITNSCNHLLTIAFEELGLNRIEILTATHNLRSTAVPLRLGFTHEGVLRQMERHGKNFFDLNIFSLLNVEWTQSTNG